MLNGICVINKPSGYTSHDIVAIMRRKLHTKRIGHAGTLDPMATGVLVLLVGTATKLSNQFINFDKAYRATLRLGVKTTTADTSGKITQELDASGIDEATVTHALRQFVGEIDQLPPMVSAVKFQGERLYKLARQGKTVERTPRRVRIDSIQLLSFHHPEAEFVMTCSKGTYVRQLAEDVGDVLGCGACISQIERTQVGPFKLEESVTLEEANESHVRSWESALA